LRPFLNRCLASSFAVSYFLTLKGLDESFSVFAAAPPFLPNVGALPSPSSPAMAALPPLPLPVVNGLKLSVEKIPEAAL